jgi:hypothetical protein
MAEVRDLIRVLRSFKGTATVSYCRVQIDTRTVDLIFEIRLSQPDDLDFSPDGFEVDADGAGLYEPVLVSNIIDFRRKK